MKEYFVPITRAINAITEQPPDHDPLEQVIMGGSQETTQPDFEEDTQFFTQEEAETNEPFCLDESERPPRPLIELKPLPSGLQYAFLNHDPKTPVIISDKLSKVETYRLIIVLEKHRSVFGYSLQDLKGISPTLCTYRIPIDPDSIPSREPQR